MSTTSPAASDQFNALAEEFLLRHRRGQQPSLSEYAARHPELAERIRELFPVLLQQDQLRPPTGPETPSREWGLPPRLGEYRLLREVGRGGMGVVYEAVQESLGRRVAVKVLPPMLHLGSYRERFEREARAAARLHHTNIVPVFDIGEHEGTPFYVMQFIEGSGLDSVFRNAQAARRPDLLSETSTHVGGRPSSSSSPFSEPPSKPASGAAPSALADPSETSYFREVARLGVQAAEGLAYAHARGVLHRDIKPSNLLLDNQGVLWIADFGLAKAEDSPDLTEQGALLGTLRYLAPERLQGRCDVRADVYALGITLHELLTLRPVFEDADRAHLLERISHGAPTRPRQLNPSIPRDLETIILKAMAHAAEDRYPTAEGLAEDLRRFLADRPILARRSSLLERLRRWQRRNPVVATLTSVVVGLALLLAVGSTIAALLLRDALGRAEQAQDDLRERLWHSYLEQARAQRHSRRPGQRVESLRVLEEAARIRVTPEVRNEVIACLALPDLEEIARTTSVWPDGAVAYRVDLAHQRYAWEDQHGGVHIRRLTDDREMAVLPGLGSPAASGLRFSSDGRFLVQRTQQQGRLRLWDLDNEPPREVLQDNVGRWFTGETPFSRDGRRLAVAHADNTVSIYDTTTGKEVHHLKVPATPEQGVVRFDIVSGLAFHDTQLAVIQSSFLRVLEIQSGRIIAQIRLPHGISSMAWHPEGRHLAASGPDGKVHLCDVAGQTIERTLDEFLPGSVVLAFHPRGDVLAATDGNGTLRLWDLISHRLLFQVSGSFACAAAGGQLLATQLEDGHLRVHRIVSERVVRQVNLRGYRVPARAIGWSVVDASGRWLAVETGKGPALVDLAELSGPLAGPSAAHSPICFDPSGNLWTAMMDALVCWSFSRQGPTRCWMEQRRQLPGGVIVYGRIAAAADAHRFVVPHGTFGAEIIHRDHPLPPVTLPPHGAIHSCALSPDGRWAVTTSSHPAESASSVKIWDAANGQLVRELPVRQAGQAAFSRDGRWLAVCGSRLRFWRTGSWEEAGSLEAGAFALTADGSMAAVTQGDRLGLYDRETGADYARLEAPDEMRPQPHCFTPDGTRLIVYGDASELLHIWDLAALRRELAARGLDWEGPPVAAEPLP